MNVIWKGQSFFVIGAKNKENGIVRVAIDPYSADIGLRVPKVEADILLCTHSHSDHANQKAVRGDPFVIEDLGEYETRDVL